MDYLTRYPGVRPFKKEEKDIFFGRDADAQLLYELIRVEKTVLLYSKSGLGKSSLINAGLIPKLDNSHYNYFTIRFGPYSLQSKTSPKEKIIEALKEKTSGLLQERFPELYENNIGYWLKSVQVDDTDKTNILIFDQFEELFTYPDEQVDELKKELGEVVYKNVSANFRDKIIELTEQRPGELTEEQLISLSSAVNIRYLFALRSDSMSKLNRLADYLPNLQRTFFELKPLNPEQAASAIICPAASEGNFKCPSFEFSHEAIQKILSALSDNFSQPIETFQLQIVCGFAEKMVLNKPEHRYIVPEDLGDIKDIHQSFYDNLIKDLTTIDEDERLHLRILLEEHFIYEPEMRRLQVLKGIVLKKISEHTLAELEKTHLIRSEPYQDSFTYELSHDTLVEPILKSFHLRKELEDQAALEARRQEELRRAQEEAENERLKRIKERKRQRRIIFIIIISAIICLFFAAISGWMLVFSWKTNNKLRHEIEASRQANFGKYLTLGHTDMSNQEYNSAILNFKHALDYTYIFNPINGKKEYKEDSMFLIEQIEQCNDKLELYDKYIKLIGQADKLQMDENSFADAMVKYKEALKLDFDNKSVELKIIDLNAKIEIAVRETINRVGILIPTDCVEAKQQLKDALRMKPGDKKLLELMKKCP